MDLKSPAFRSANVMHGIPAPRGWSTTQKQQKEDSWDSTQSYHKKEETGFSWPPSPKSIRETSLDAEEIFSLPKMREDTKQWEWQLNTVSPLPMFYPIQEWNTLTVDDLSLNIITARISEFLRLHSIAADYNDQQGSVRCRTLSRVEFAINIWQNRKKTPAFLVHIQHVSGCSMQLNRLQAELRRAILNPGMDEIFYRSSGGSCGDVGGALFRSIDMNIREGEMEPALITTDEEPPLELCRRLLSSQQWCERRLGLESLVILTDQSKTIPSAVREASSAVLFDSNCQRFLKGYLSMPASDGTDHYGYASGNYVLALQIIAQSLQCFNIASRKRVASSENRLFWQPVLAALSNNIQNAASRPLEACLSVQCLEELNDIPQALSPIDANNLDERLHNAHQFGIQHNASLETETKRLICRLRTAAR
jgi:hypothetical protein